MTFEYEKLTAREIAAGVRAGKFTALAITEAALATIDRTNGINAFVEVWADHARAAAETIDQAVARGDEVGPMAGVPVGLKDLFLREGRTAQCGSRILEGFVAPYSATCVERLEAAGAVLIGRTNMDEFAMGGSNEHSAFGPVQNPVDNTRVPGGSSGGSAAAVAARMVPLALGSDTGGSVRQPAAFCGVLGLKPTYGRIPRFGMVAFASSLDTVSPIARDADDLALALDVMAGPDHRDATAVPTPHAATLDSLAAPNVDGLRIGVPEALFGEGVDPEVAASTRAELERLAEQGATLVDIELPHLKHGIPAYYLICTSEASSNLSRFDGVRFGRRIEGRTLDEVYTNTRTEGFGREVKRRILLGTYSLLSGTYEERYLKATQVRTLIRQDFEKAFESCDVIATPTTPTTAFELGSKVDDPLAMYLGDLMTVPANLAGIPAVSVPCDAVDGLPVGLQFFGPALGEATLLGLAKACAGSKKKEVSR